MSTESCPNSSPPPKVVPLPRAWATFRAFTERHALAPAEELETLTRFLGPGHPKHGSRWSVQSALQHIDRTGQRESLARFLKAMDALPTPSSESEKT